MKKILYGLSLLCIVLVLSLPTNTSGGTLQQVRVSITQSADLVSVRDALAAHGGVIEGYMPERAFVIRIDDTMLPQLHSIPGVAEVRQTASPGEQLGVPVPGLGDIPPTPEEAEFVNRTFTRVDSMDATALSLDRALLEGAVLRPSAVDNSLSKYFPPIASQGEQGSCTAWATCYYYSTYLQAMDEGIDVTEGVQDPRAVAHIHSPAFLYNLVNGGGDNGASTPAVVARLNEVGCGSWLAMPYSDANFTTWPTQEAWVNALNNRTSVSNTIDLTSDAGLETLKQHLANGHIAVTRTNVYANWYSTFLNNQGRGISNGVLFSHNGETFKGSHALTIIGYDDNKEYTDGGSTKKGAFLVANSWGTSWGVPNSTETGSGGFFWVAYEYVKAANGAFDQAFFNTDRPHYRPHLYAVAALEHTQRGFVAYRGGIQSVLGGTLRSYYPINRAGGFALPLDPTLIGGAVRNRIAVDLTDTLMALEASSTLFVEMQVVSGAAQAGTIRLANFYYDPTGDGVFEKIASATPPVTVAQGSTRVATAPLTVFHDFSDVSEFKRNGDARQVSAALRLTEDVGSQRGSTFLAHSLLFGPDTSFQTYFVFRISGVRGSGEGGSDGLAFVIQNDPQGAAALGNSGEGLGFGINDSNGNPFLPIKPSVAIEFDTFPNGFDGSDGNHVALILDGNVQDHKTRASLPCPSQCLNSGEDVYVWIKYNGMNNLLQVFLSQQPIMPTTPLMATVIDLFTHLAMSSSSSQPVFFGFTAGTGARFNIHEVRSWSLTTQPLVVPGMLGDLDGDGCVDQRDLGTILLALRTPGPQDLLFDFNSDSNVNIADARKLVTRFTNPRGVSCP